MNKRNTPNHLTGIAIALALVLLIFHPAAVLAETIDEQTEVERSLTSEPAIATTAGERISTSNIDGWNIDLSRMEKALARKGTGDRDFDSIHEEATIVLEKATALANQLTPGLKTLKERLAQLGPAPEKGQPEESEEIATRRKNLNSDISRLDGFVKAAQLVAVRAQQLRASIIEVRRTRFVRSVTSRSHSILDPQLWQSFSKDFLFVGKALPGLIGKISTTVSQRLAQQGNTALMAAGSLALLIGLLLLASRGLNRIKTGMGRMETDRSIHAITAFINILISGVIPALAILSIVWVLDRFNLFAVIHRPFVVGVGIAIAFAIAISAIAYAFLQPGHPVRRIVGLSDTAARRVMILAITMLIIFVISWTVYDAGRVSFASLEFGIAIQALFALAVAVLTMMALRVIRRDRKHDLGGSEQHGLGLILNWNVLRSVASIGVLLIIVALITGYIALAEFTANQVLLTSTVLATLWLVLRIIDDNLVGCFQTGHDINDRISTFLGWKHTFTQQIGVVLIGFLRLIVIIFTILILLVPWGYRARDFFEWISAAFFGFKVGDITISLSLILSAIVVFLIGVIVTRALQSWLTHRFLPTTKLDGGVRNSISTVFGYIGIMAAAMITISFAGFDLTSLAFVAGALSVGIGFGLQSVVSNFVSGLILLAERPIKAGDWVVTSGGEGTVRKISVRSTEIETFDRSTVVVPNSTLITDSVENWNHRSSMGRIRIPVGVDYESDPEEVREILYECAKAHDGILDNPGPLVYFMDFGPSSLDFELRCYLADVGNGLSVRSDLRYAIFAALKKAGISIPFPQQDVHIRDIKMADLDTLSAATGRSARRKSTAAGKTRQRVTRDDD